MQQKTDYFTVYNVNIQGNQLITCGQLVSLVKLVFFLPTITHLVI